MFFCAREALNSGQLIKKFYSLENQRILFVLLQLLDKDLRAFYDGCLDVKKESWGEIARQSLKEDTVSQ
jgi:hypothetical protein